LKVNGPKTYLTTTVTSH